MDDFLGPPAGPSASGPGSASSTMPTPMAPISTAVPPTPGPGTAGSTVPVPPFLAKVRAARAASGSSTAGAGSSTGANGTNGTSGNASNATAATPPALPPLAINYPSPSHSSLPPAQLATPAATQPPPNALYLPPPAAPSVEEDLVPPENFSAVTQGVYRCGFPKKRNFKFLETLQLKTVLTLVLEDYPEANLEWCQDQDVQFMQFGIPGNKEPFDNIPEDVICSALVAILDRRNHPLLIHCNKGKHRTGCLIGCIRRLQSWSLTSIFDEYRRFSSPKSRAVDQQFIDLFDIAPVWEEVVAVGGGLSNLPNWPMLTLPLSYAALRETERERASERERRAVAANANARVEMEPVEVVEIAAR